MKNLMDGSGKSIKINTHYLGSAKQIPFLIKGIREIMPNLQIDLYGDIQNSHNSSNIENILLADLNQENINTSLINIEYSFDTHNNFGIQFHLNNSEICNGNKSFFWVDPLKFEQRTLLDKSQIIELKKHYKLPLDKKILLAGSFHPGEIDLLINSVERVKDQENFITLVVPRMDPGKLMKKFNEIQYETDEEIVGDASYKIIFEKGILDRLYSICDLAIIGDSFSLYTGGQNPLEPAFYGKPMICGGKGRDFYQHNNTAYQGLEKSGLLRKISYNDLPGELIREISSEDLDKFQKNAQQFIESKQGAGLEYARLIQKKIYDPNYELAGIRSSDLLSFWSDSL